MSCFRMKENYKYCQSGWESLLLFGGRSGGHCGNRCHAPRFKRSTNIANLCQNPCSYLVANKNCTRTVQTRTVRYAKVKQGRIAHIHARMVRENSASHHRL